MLKALPPWAWVLALACGAIVGFVLLKPGRGKPEEGEGGEPAGEPAGAKGGGGGGAPPIPRESLEAYGLAPGEYQYASYGDFGDSGSDGGSDGFGSGPSSDVQTLAVPTSHLAGYLGPTSPAFSSPTFQAPSSGPASSQVYGNPTFAVPVSSPTPSGGGSQQNLAQ